MTHGAAGSGGGGAAVLGAGRQGAGVGRPPEAEVPPDSCQIATSPVSTVNVPPSGEKGSGKGTWILLVSRRPCLPLAERGLQGKINSTTQALTCTVLEAGEAVPAGRGLCVSCWGLRSRGSSGEGGVGIRGGGARAVFPGAEQGSPALFQHDPHLAVREHPYRRARAWPSAQHPALVTLVGWHGEEGTRAR